MTTDRGEAAIYVISVAAELAGMHPQTLRQYDRLGLVTPQRTRGRGRRYTPSDIHRLREIQRLSQEEGVNLAGIHRIMGLTDRIASLEAELDALHQVIKAAAPGVHRVFTADSHGRINARSPHAGAVREADSCGEMVVRGQYWFDHLPPELAQLLAAVALSRSRQGG